MKTKYWNSKTYWYTVFTYTFLALVLVLTGYFVNLFNLQRRAAVDVERDNEKNISESASRLNGALSNLKILVTQIGSLPWAIKLMVDYPGGEYTSSSINRRTEITKEFSLFVGTDMHIENLSLVYPYRQVMIARNSWSNTDVGLWLLGVPSAEKESLLAQIRAIVSPCEIQDIHFMKNAASTLMLCYPLESARVPRVYALVLINANKFVSQYAPALSDNLVGFRILRPDGSEVASISAPKGNTPVSIVTVAAAGFGWVYEFETTSQLGGSEYTEARRSLSVRFSLLIVAGLALSFALSVFTYRPISKLKNRIASSANSVPGRQNDYDIINSYLDTVDVSETEFKRSELLLELLSNSEETDEYISELEKVGIHLDMNTYFQTFVITSSHTLSNDLLTLITDTRATAYCIRVSKGEYVLIAAFADEESAIAGCRAILTELKAQHGAEYINGSIVSGIIDIGITGLRTSWNCAKNRAGYLRSIHIDNLNMYYCPMELETRFVQSLSSGQEESVVKILEDLRSENGRMLATGKTQPEDIALLINHISDILLRYMYENNISNSEPYRLLGVIARSDNLQSNWIYLEQMCRQICKANRQEKKSNMESPPASLAERIMQFTGEHFSDPKMSLLWVSEQFGISINTVNNLLKLSIGKTFLAYLTKCRIDEAKKLVGGGLSITQIAERIGYANTRSFRRAFARCTGVSPASYEDEGELVEA
jgi:AraC-like DNA-binding protein